ncbi:MAG: hypothetical protein U1F56_13755 [Rubrivivax sp.]
MFPADVPDRFTREYGCTLPEWLRDLPRALGAHAAERPAPDQVQVALPGGGRLHLHWSELPPRQIALVRLPRLQVDFRFEGTDAAARAAFMHPFDLTLQRGGG